MKIHVVQKGDTLWELANQYDVDFEELKQLNPQLSSPDMIMPGMKIKIPSSKKSVQKEEKETKKPETVHPYKEMQQPKPVPIIKEDEKEKQKHVQPHMPEQSQKPKEQQQNPKEQQQNPKEQQKQPSVPQMPEQPQMPAPQQPVPTPQMPNQQEQPIIQMPIMEQELNNYTSVQVPEMTQYQQPHQEQPEEYEKPMQHPMPMPPMHPMPQPAVMVPVCCQMIPPGAMPMSHPPLPAAPAGNHNCGPYGHFKQHGYPHPYDEYGMMMESPNMEMPVKPSLNDQDCGCGNKKPVPAYHPYHHNGQEMHHHQPFFGTPNHFGFPYSGSEPYQPHPSHYSTAPNHPSFSAHQGYPNFSGGGYRAEEDESSGE